MKEMELKCYTKLKYIVMDSKGIYATMHLLELLYNDKVGIEKCKMKVNHEKHTIKIITEKYTYEFNNVPTQWNNGIDISTLYKLHIESLKEGGVL